MERVVRFDGYKTVDIEDWEDEDEFERVVLDELYNLVDDKGFVVESVTLI